MKVNLLYLYGGVGLLCGLTVHALCDDVQPSSQLLSSKPVITSRSTAADLDNYVQYFRQQGYTVVERKQELNGAGTIASFHFRAVRPKGKLSPASPKSSVETDGDYRGVTEKTTGGREAAPNSPSSPAEFLLRDKPKLAKRSTQADVSAYMMYFRQRGYVITAKQQQFSRQGQLLLFRFRADRSVSGLAVDVQTLVTPKIARETVHVKSVIHADSTSVTAQPNTN